MRICIFTLFLLGSWLSGAVLFGQALPPGQPEQDCVNAIPVCNNVYTQPNSYQGAGQIPGEIDSTNSCLGAGEENDVWYIFTVQTPGDLCFTLTPANGVDDYDWAVYNLSNASCSDIFTQAPNLEVACNFSGGTGCGAITGPNGNPNCPAQNDPCVPVLAGETYVVNVSNYSGTGSGYTLDFSQSTAVIFDNIPPAIDTIQITCTGALEVVFSENVLCSSVDVNDFLVTSQVNGVTYPVSSIFSDACALGGTFDQNFELQLAGSPPVGPLEVIIDGTVTDNCGNAAILGIGDTTVLTNPLPIVNIAATDDSICAGEAVTLTVPDFDFTTYTWSIAGTDTFQNVSPTTTTEYWVELVDTAGCVRTDTIEIFVRPTPDPTFSANAQVCVDSIADIVYQGGAGPGATFAWDFGGGTIQSGTGVGPYEVSFSNGGTYPISLVVIENGCVDSTSTNVVVPPQPTAQLNLPAQICLGDTALIGLMPPTSGSATYTWDFDGGVDLSGNGAGPYQVDWLSPGSKSVCVIVDESGCLSPPICANVQVNVPPGGSILNVAPQCLSGNQFSFVYQGSPSIQSYQWDLGEAGLSSNSLNPVISYDTAGTKEISVIVTDSNGCSSQSQLTAEVYPMPEADFVADTVCADASTSFQDRSITEPGHDLDGYAWDFGDSNISSQINPNHTYATAGGYQVQLLVTSVDGCQDSVTKQVPVRANPIAGFTFGRYCVNQSSPLTNSSEVPNLPVDYRWQFPDGSESEAFEPFYSDDERGEKPITLTVTNGFGCTDSYTDTLLVFGLPQAGFESDLTCEGESMPLRSTVEVEPGDTIASYQWLMGDGAEVEGETIDYPYAEAGRYLVTHKVETALGCRDSVADSVIVWARPQAGFVQQETCVDEATVFESTSLPDFLYGGELLNWRWQYGDGNQGSGETTEHTYRAAGDYQVQLVVETDKGCADTLTRLIPAYPRPPAPETEGDSICAGEVAFLRSNEPQYTDRILWYDEALNGSLVGSDTLFRTPELWGSAFFYAVAESDRGCQSEPTPTNVRVAPTPEGEILASESVVEMPEAIVSFAVRGNFEGETFRWDFGEGNQSEETNPTHNFEGAGRRRVQVEITTLEGCLVTLETLIMVERRFNLSIPSAFSPNNDGFNDVYEIGSYQVQSIQFVVYNRWGQAVYSTDQPDFQWDGSSDKGRALPSGTYAYRASGIDVHGRDFEVNGTITVLR